MRQAHADEQNATVEKTQYLEEKASRFLELLALFSIAGTKKEQMQINEMKKEVMSLQRWAKQIAPKFSLE